MLSGPRTFLSRATKTLGPGAMVASLSSAAWAHTGHGTSGFSTGLAHPFGADHLLAMVAVGLWSVVALPAAKAWQGPATFLVALVAGAALGTTGVSVPWLEHGIALSVVMFGVLLVLAHRGLPRGLGLGLVAAAAALHGLAHGAEAPASGSVAYAAGFLLTTCALHLGGVAVGLGLKRGLAERSGWALGGLGSALGIAGLYLFTQA